MGPDHANDMRGIVDPAAMLEVVDFDRYPAGPELAGVVEWFWSVAWALPDGEVHHQEVLNHPAGNVSIGTVDDAGRTLDPAEGRVYGVQRSISRRRLVGRGWTVAARSTVGGLGVLLDAPAREAADRQLPLDAVSGLDAERLVAAVVAETATAARIGLLRRALAAVVAQRDPARMAEAVQVAELVRVVEHDRSLCRVEQLAGLVGVSVRSLQRLFDQHVGASPSFVIRRWRIIEAAEAARRADGRAPSPRPGGLPSADAWPGWAAVAAELGYADQAHLTRDFVRHLGVPPSVYVARNRAPGATT